ncbi:phytanoyl-CoA dioxygenase PhyH [Halobacteriovorax sp. BALOs_7]|uniref:phytanoyl-CoA dioxygenase family protein n=1 Tax=unclassified Halobacteriovorax TaxID=2639665 RepID=UPI000EA3B598|nr:phytanoyl-CoA dioxygenase family protein [Halobacteriovorax sp. BALOs_7]AYF44577.1 phytanoyl-CoA dioxygenase PhyH [Halobacteriovorax sp. BALOs_7]
MELDYDKLVKDFYQQGYCVVEGLFDPKDLKNIEKSFDNLYQASLSLDETQMLKLAQFVFNEDALNRIVWCGGYDEFLLDVGADKRILNIVSRILESNEMVQLINQAHFKLPGQKVEFKWHQDSEHRRYGTHMWEDVDGRGSYVQTLLAIDDMNADNGPLKFIPNSNQEGHLNYKEDPSIIDEMLEKYEAVDVMLKAGDVAFFGPYVFHSSSLNKTDSPRRVLINGYAQPGANKREYPGVGLGRHLKLNS